MSKANAADMLTPPRKALEIVQMDHTLVDIMVVDEVRRQSIGRPWITVAFDIGTRVVLGFALRLEPPSATSVGLALAMACLPKEQRLKDRHLDLNWGPFGVPALVHVDNGKEFHSLAVTRGCERHGISLEYRPPGRPQYGGHPRNRRTQRLMVAGFVPTIYPIIDERANCMRIRRQIRDPSQRNS